MSLGSELRLGGYYIPHLSLRVLIIFEFRLVVCVSFVGSSFGPSFVVVLRSRRSLVHGLGLDISVEIEVSFRESKI